MCNNHNLGVSSINAYAKFGQLFLKILSENEIRTSIKGHNCYKFVDIDV